MQSEPQLSLRGIGRIGWLPRTGPAPTVSRRAGLRRYCHVAALFAMTGGPSTGSGRTGGSPSPQPSPIKGEGAESNIYGQDLGRECHVAALFAMIGCPSTGSGRTGGSNPHPSPLPSRERGRIQHIWTGFGAVLPRRCAFRNDRGSFDRLRTNGGFTLTLSSPIQRAAFRQAQD